MPQVGIAALQVGIQLTGNFGHFNVLTIALCVPLLACTDADGSIPGGLFPEVYSRSVAEAMATPTVSKNE